MFPCDSQRDPLKGEQLQRRGLNLNTRLTVYSLFCFDPDAARPRGRLPACLPVCLSPCMSFCLSVCLTVFLAVSLSACLPACLSLCLFLSVSVCLSSCLPVRVSACMPACLSVCCLPACLSVPRSPLSQLCFDAQQQQRIRVSPQHKGRTRNNQRQTQRS